MCGDCKDALARRIEAADRLLEVCSGRDALKRSLRLVYPAAPVPDDMMALAMRIGGQG